MFMRLSLTLIPLDLVLQKTSAYAHLDDSMRHNLYEIYVDYFFRRQEDMWAAKAKEKLPIMKVRRECIIRAEWMSDPSKHCMVLHWKLPRQP